MVKEYKVFCVAGWKEYTNWFPFKIEFVKSVEEADIVVFEGGEDVSPQLYGQPKHPRTYSNIDRDNYEIPIYKKSVELGKSIVSICRGSQLSCIMAGGILVQHQNNPGAHLMKTFDGLKTIVTSTHHQAQYPFTINSDDYKILGWTEDMLSFHQGGYEEEMHPDVECEVVYYSKINSLAIQPHPEMMIYKGIVKEVYIDSIKWFQEVLIQFLNNKL